MREPVPGSNQY